MNAIDLQRLAGHPRNHGLRVVALEPELRLHATNPQQDLLADEVVAEEGRYVTSILYEIGGRGREKAYADRHARLLSTLRHATAGALWPR